MYAARITPEEFASRKYRLIQQGPLVTLEKDPKTDACVYLDHSKCSIHEMKPENCKDWHCSPGGVGEGIKERANGWILLKKEA
jgi:Fe-S-cluster containining protein